MQETMELRAPDTKADDAVVVLAYPDNNLGSQVRQYDETFSVFTVLTEAFFAKK